MKAACFMCNIIFLLPVVYIIFLIYFLVSKDYLEVDDDVHANGVASAPIFNGVDGNELAKSSAGFSDNPQSAAISAEKPQVPEPKPSTISLGTSKEESLPDGSTSTQKITGFSFPVGLSTSSPSSMNTQAAVSSPQPTAEIDKIAGSSEKINEITAYSSNSAKGAPFTFSASSFNAESAVSKEVKPELRSRYFMLSNILLLRLDSQQCACITCLKF